MECVNVVMQEGSYAMWAQNFLCVSPEIVVVAKKLELLKLEMEQHRDHACRIIIDANRPEDVLNAFLIHSALDWVTIVETIDASVEMGQLVIQRKALNA